MAGMRSEGFIQKSISLNLLERIVYNFLSYKKLPMKLLDGYTTPDLLSLLPLPEHSTHLDVGPGEFAIWTHLLHGEVLSRSSGHSITSFQLDLFQPKSVMNDSLVRAKSESLPFSSGIFDVVTMGYLLDLLSPEEQLSTVREAHRVLKVGGHILGDVMFVPQSRKDDADSSVFLGTRFRKLYLLLMGALAKKELAALQSSFAQAGFEMLLTGLSYDRNNFPLVINHVFLAKKVREA